MVRWFVRANRYYSEFSGLFTYVSPLDWRVVGTSVFGVLFIGSLVSILLNLTSFHVTTKLIGLAIFEVIFLTFYKILTVYKNKKTISAFNLVERAKLTTVEQVKISRLKSVLNCEQDEFLNEAKHLDEMLSLLNKHSQPFSFSVISFAEWIYHKDARPRIITLLIFLASAVVVLSVRQEASLDTVFQFYLGVSWTDLGVFYLILVALSGLTLFALSQGFKLCVQWFLHIERLLNGSQSLNLPAVQYLIRDLLAFHSKELLQSPKKVRFIHQTRGKKPRVNNIR